MKSLPTLILLIFILNIKMLGQTITYIKQRDMVMVGRSMNIQPFICGMPKSSSVSIQYYRDEKLLGSSSNTEIFTNKMESGGIQYITAIASFKSNNKIYKIDTQMITLSGFYPNCMIKIKNGGDRLYVGLDDELLIMAEGFIGSKLDIISEGGCQLINNGSGKYTIRVDKRKDLITLHVSANDEGEWVKVGKFTIPVDNVPIPEIILSSNHLFLDSSFEIKVGTSGRFPLNYKSGIDSFYCVYPLKGVEVKKFIIGSKVPYDIIEELRTLPKGAWVYFKDIHYWFSASEIKNHQVCQLAIGIP